MAINVVAQQGYAARLWYAAAAAPVWNSVGKAVEFNSESITRTPQILDTEGLRGVRARHDSRIRYGQVEFGGSIVWNPSPVDLDNWLTYITGDVAGSPYTPVDDLETNGIFSILIDRVGEQFEYNDCRVNTWNLRGTAGELVETEIDLRAKTETENPTLPTPAIPIATIDQPFFFSEAVLTIDGTVYEVMDFEFVIDNALQVRFATGQTTATSITASDRTVVIRATVPYDSTNHTAFYEPALAGFTGTNTLVITNATPTTPVSITITLDTLQGRTVNPTIGGRGEIVMPIEFQSRDSGTDGEFSIATDIID